MAYTTINKSTDYFNTVLWTTDGTGNKALTTGHSTDMVWIKFRDYAYDHRIYDDVRGVTKKIIPNKTDAESTTTDLASFDTNGFTVGSNLNSSGEGGLVGWSWKANGSGSSNTDGSITSTVSASTTSGFSIVKYTGTGANATIGHGLGVAPKIVLVKDLSASASWRMYTEMTGNESQLALDQDSAADSGNTTMWNSTSPTTTTFSIGTHGNVNTSSNNYIAYCFSQKSGFSSMGSYVGNGSTDGSFIYTSMKPAFILIKRSASTAAPWCIFDNKRDGYNPNKLLLANNTNVESSPNFDIVSNGFKTRTADGEWNASGSTYIYMAFSEESIVSSNGVPATAR